VKKVRLKKTTVKIKTMYLIIITCLFALITPLFLVISGFALPPQYDNTFLGELKYKYAHLEHTDGPKIIIIGGSSVAFGIDSSLMEEKLPGYSVVNFGLYGGLGTKAMLELSIDSIKKGDIIIISPEQESQTLSNYFNGEAMWQALDGSFYLLKNLDKKELGEMVGEFPYFAADKFSYYIKGDEPDPTGIYNRSSFNKYGDISTEDCTYNIMEDGYDVNTPIYLNKKVINTEFIDYLNQYASEAESRGATVWYHFCPMNKLAVQNPENADGYYDYLQKKLDFYIIGNPNQSIMDMEWFYDTNFHLNSSGKIVNTNQLIRDIKAMLEDSSATGITLPQKPEILMSLEITGDNSDEDCFTYEINNGEMQLTGLTEKGKQRETLIVPVSHEKMTVTKISEEIFAGDENVKTIVLQENITSIEDSAFKDCKNLTSIKLLNLNPGECSVGQKLLEGTNASIVVDEKAVTDYKLNYFWSVYSNRIVSE